MQTNKLIIIPFLAFFLLMFNPAFAYTNVAIDELQTNWITYENSSVRFNGTFLFAMNSNYAYAEGNGYIVEIFSNGFDLTTYDRGERLNVTGYAWISCHEYDKGKRRISVGNYTACPKLYNGSDYDDITTISTNYPLTEPELVTNISDYDETDYGKYIKSEQIVFKDFGLITSSFWYANWYDVQNANTEFDTFDNNIHDNSTLEVSDIVILTGFPDYYYSSYITIDGWTEIAERYQPDKDSGAFAWFNTNDGTCAGEIFNQYYFDFNTTASYIGEQGTPTNSEELVNNSYHYGINDTAYHFSASGQQGDGNHPAFYFYENGQNITVDFDITSFEVDLYNMTLENITANLDVLAYMRLWNTGKRYRTIYEPNFDFYNDISDSYVKAEYRRIPFHGKDYSCSYEWINGTEIQYYYNCPINFTRIDWILFNFPYGDEQAINWNVDFVMDNMKVLHKESDAMSSDCAKSYDSISDIPSYPHFINFDGVAYIGQNGMIERMKFIKSVLCDYEYISYLVTDDSEPKPSIHMKFNLEDSFVDALIPINISKGNLVNYTCLLYPNGVAQYPYYLECHHPYINGWSAIDETEYRKYMKRLDDYNVLADNYAIDKIDTFTINYYGQTWKYNDTFWAENYSDTGLTFRNKYYYADILGIDHAVIDKCWGDFDYWEYSINSAEGWNLSADFRLYSKEERADIVDAENSNKPLILSGMGLKNIYISADFDNPITQMWRGEDGSLSTYAIIGDGKCSWLESYNPDAWNYEPECEIERYGSITGFTVASAGKNMLAIVLVFSVIGLMGLMAYSSYSSAGVSQGFKIALISIFAFILVLIGLGIMYSNW